MTNLKPSKVFRNPKKRVENRVNTYKARRTLQINGQRRQPGQLVPEAHTWLRVANIEHAGYLDQVQVPEAEFDAAVEEFCPDLTERLAEKAKGLAVAQEDDTKFTGYRMDEDGNVIDLAAQRRLERELQLANTAPNDRTAPDHTGGTPADIEESTPENWHSDGGPTPWIEGQHEAVEELADEPVPSAEDAPTAADTSVDEPPPDETPAKATV